MFTKGSRYLLKLQPTAVCHVSATRQQKTQYPAAHMVIVVSEGERQVLQVDGSNEGPRQILRADRLIQGKRAVESRES